MTFENIYKSVMYAIYNTYECESTAIYEKVKTKHQMTYKVFTDILSTLQKQNCIKVESVNIGVRGGKRSIVLITDAGEQFALKYFDKVLQEREAEKLLRVHGTLEHGYFNKYCVDNLKERGFDVKDEYADNRFETSLIGENGQSLICESDFNIVYNNSRYLFEAETGKCQKENIYQKLDKVYDLADSDWIAPIMFYICPNKKACEKVSDAINIWRQKTGIYDGFDVVVVNASIRDKIATEIKKVIV